jgi:hypothetical protein
METLWILNKNNFDKGFLIDEEVIAGVTLMDGGIYAAYMSHYLTGETLAYQEFSDAESAVAYLKTIERPWAFEAVGCSKTTSKLAKLDGSASTGGCSTGGCTGCACK